METTIKITEEMLVTECRLSQAWGMYQERMAIFKRAIKALAKHNKQYNNEFKRMQREDGSCNIDYSKLPKFAAYDAIVQYIIRNFNAREVHVAYSICKGNRYENIERKVRDDNQINMKRVDQLIVLMTGCVDYMGSMGNPMLMTSDQLYKYQMIYINADWLRRHAEMDSYIKKVKSPYLLDRIVK